MSAPLVEDVLAEVNRLRGECGMDALDQMPKGDRRHAGMCPIARAIEGGSVSDVLLYGEATDRGWIEPPRVIAEFIRAFDLGAYPDLIA